METSVGLLGHSVKHMEGAPSFGGMRSTIVMLLACLTGVVVAQVFFAFRGTALQFDEIGQYCRISSFLSGTWRTQDCRVVTLPGYHVLVAWALSLWGASSVPAARTVSFFLSLLSCIPIFLITRILHRGYGLLRAIQIVTLPILLPFFPLLYTDVLGLGMLLWALLAALRRWPLLAAILLTAAICVRQNAILWLPLIAVVSLEGNILPHLFLGSLGSLLRRGYAFLLPIVFFCAFLLLNGSPSLNRSAVTPSVTFSLGNIFFALFLFAVLFLPLVLRQAPRMATILRERWRISMLLLVFFIIFIFGFDVTHPINQSAMQVRDLILRSVAGGGLPWMFFFLSTAIAFLTMLVTPLERPKFLLLYPVAFIVLSTTWMIETRYAIVPLVLFLLFRKSQSWRMEMIQVAYNLALCLWVFMG